MVALIGSGNVAHWVAQRLKGSAEFPIKQVYSRQMSHAQALAAQVGAEAIDDLLRLDPSCDIFIFAIKDDAFAEVMAQLPFTLSVAVHTAGTVSQHVFASKAANYGVLYPLQTFTKGVSMQEVKVPLCIESSMLGAQKEKVRRLAKQLSDCCYDIDEEDRAVLHLAAVFACNFSNAMTHVAENILQNRKLDRKLLLPLMRQTLDKLERMPAEEAQTGPAVRHDKLVMEKHLNRISSEEIKTIYQVISSYIMQYVKAEK